MQAAGLRTLATYGMSEANGEVALSGAPDEHHDYKLVFIAACESQSSSKTVHPS